MISLSAAAVIEDARAAELIAHAHQTRANLGDRGIPIDLLEATVGAASHRGIEAVLAVLIVVDALRLLACVPVRGDVLLVAAHAGDMAAVDLHLEAAIDATKDARGLGPFVIHREDSFIVQQTNYLVQRKNGLSAALAQAQNNTG